ncbi:MAG: hypothetical protein ACHQ4G_10625 [Opitutales bacterium]
MIDASEHFYHDDPAVGPADVRTQLKDVEYFFLGNGLIQAAVQWSPAGEGTFLGLLVMDPDRLGKKRDALTLDARAGLAPTQVRVRAAAGEFAPAAGRGRVAWAPAAPVPTVVARWAVAGLQVTERFSCPEWNRPRLCREIVVRNRSRRRVTCELVTGRGAGRVIRRLALAAGASRSVVLGYTLAATRKKVVSQVLTRRPADAAAQRFWRSLARVRLGDPRLDHFFAAARAQLPAAVSRRGRLDGSIWQYNLEWLRDQAMIALALTLVGAVEPATTIFDRLLRQFVTPEGDTLDSSEKRNPADVELDQNGILLCTLKDYVLWTGNLDLVRRHWAKVAAATEFPLQAVFRHPESGLLVNCREFWERHRVHGIQPGLELIYQCYVAHGLAAAAILARMTGHAAEAARWDAEGARLKDALLHHPRFRMHDRRGFIKRRGPDGQVQETVTAGPAAQLPTAVPLGGPGPHFLNPDTSAVLPIALGMIPADSPLARRTLKSMDALWNQDWRTGGYGRYHVTSEPDSPGGWPFASLFVARAAVEMGDEARFWRVLRWLDRVPGARAGTWFEFYGRRLAPPFPQVGIVVWNWAELIVLYVQHLLGVRPGEYGLSLSPRLPAGLAGATAALTLGGRRLHLKVRRRGKTLEVTVNGRVRRAGPDGQLSVLTFPRI